MHELRSFYQRFREFFLNAGLFSLFINLALLAPSLYMLQIFDRVLASRSNETLLMLTLAAFMGLLVLLFLDYLRGLLLQGAGAALDRMVGERVIAALIENASRIQRSENVHGLRDVAVLRGFLSGNSIIALFDAPWMIFYVLLIFLFHPLLGMVAVAGALVLFMLTWCNERLNRTALEKIQLDSRRSSHFIDQGLENADVINAMGMTRGFVARWKSMNDLVLTGTLSTGKAMGRITSLSRFTRQFIQVAMMAVGAYLVIDQHMTSGIMIATTIILGRALAPVESLIGNWNHFVQARAAFVRLSHCFESEPSVQRTRLPAPSGQLTVDRVMLAGNVPDRPIIWQVSFELAAGEALAIVGPSASGKSCLARLIIGVWKPSAGTVRMDGADISGVDRSELGPYLGYLPQDVELFPGTVSDNIARMGTVDSEAVIAAAKRANVHEMILRLPKGYETEIGRHGQMLSGGQMQRIGLARALYGDPRLVVLDEPNANLDAEGEALLVRSLGDLRQAGVTVVMITHKPSLVGGMDKVLVMKEGRAELFGPRDEVMARVMPAASLAATA